MKRSLAIGALVVLVTLAGIPAPAASGHAHFGVTDVTFVPSTPAPGETVSVEVTVANFQTSPNTIEVTDVAIRTRRGDSFKELTRVEDVGTLNPGAKLTVPIPFTFDSAGTRTYNVKVWARLPDGSTETITYPVIVRVRNEHPSLSVQSVDAVASTSSPMNVTLSNGLDTPIRNVDVSLSGADVTGARTAHRATLAQGGSATFSFDVKPDAAGDRAVNATISYTTEGGVRRTTTQTLHYQASSLDTSVALDTTRVDSGSAVRATVSNLGNVPAENVVVTGTVGDRVVEHAALGTVPPGQSRTVVLNASRLDGRADLEVAAAYRTVDTRHTKTQTVTVAGNPATIELTGIDIEREAGKLHVTGSTSNLGLEPASSVVVRVLNTDHVTPAYPGRNYFVGSVPPSDFVSFDVYASVTPNATSIPLEVTYLRDGVQHRTVVEIPVADQVQQRQPSSTSGPPGTGILPYAIAAVVLVAVAGLVVVAWRNYRART